MSAFRGRADVANLMSTRPSWGHSCPAVGPPSWCCQLPPATGAICAAPVIPPVGSNPSHTRALCAVKGLHLGRFAQACGQAVTQFLNWTARRAASAWSEGSRVTGLATTAGPRSVRPFPLLAPGPLRAQAGSFGGASKARFGNGMYGLAFGTLPACSASFAAQPRSPKAMKPAASSSNRRRPRLRAIGAFNTQQSAATIRTTTPPRAIRQRAGPTILGKFH